MHVSARDHAQVLIAHVQIGLQIKVLGRGDFNVVNAPLRHQLLARIVQHARYGPRNVIQHRHTALFVRHIDHLFDLFVARIFPVWRLVLDADQIHVHATVGPLHAQQHFQLAVVLGTCQVTCALGRHEGVVAGDDCRVEAVGNVPLDHLSIAQPPVVLRCHVVSV